MSAPTDPIDPHWRHDLTSHEETTVAVAVATYAKEHLIPAMTSPAHVDKFTVYPVTLLWSHWRIYLRMTYGGEYVQS